MTDHEVGIRNGLLHDKNTSTQKHEEMNYKDPGTLKEIPKRLDWREYGEHFVLCCDLFKVRNSLPYCRTSSAP